MFNLSRDMSGISHFLGYFESGIWDGICKVGYAKEVSQAGQTSFCAGSGELRRSLHCRATLGRGSARMPELSLPILAHLYSFIASISSPIYMLFSYHSGTHDYPRCRPHTVSIHCADLVPTIRDSDLRSLAMSTQPLTLIFAQPLCPPPPDLPLLPCTPFGAVL